MLTGAHSTCYFLLVSAPILLAFGIAYFSHVGRIVSFLDLVGAVHTFPKVWRPMRILSGKLGGRFTGPPPESLKIRSTDLWVITPPKCGTTWITHIAHQLRVRGKHIDFVDQDDVVPWVEMLDTDFYNGTALNRNPNAEQIASPRIFKSHLGFGYLPGGDYKKVFVFREPGDALVSAAKFLPSLWGIVDPPTLYQLCSYFLANGDIASMLENLVHVWHVRHRDDVLLLFYEDVKAEPETTVKRLAQFMGVPVDQSLTSLVVSQTTHDAMCANHSVFANLAQAKNMHRAQGLYFEPSHLVGKVRRDGGRVGSVAELPESMLSALRRSWQFHVSRHLGFEDYNAMRDARRFELRGHSLPPLVDIQPLFGASDTAIWRSTAENLAAAATKFGVARIVGHGVNASQMLDLASRYFSLPERLRGGNVRNVSVGFQRGSIPFAGESGSQDFLEVKESFLYGYEWSSNSTGSAPSNPLEGHNVWPPPHPLLGPDWHESLQRYYTTSVTIAKYVLNAVDAVLGRDDKEDSATMDMSKLCDGGENISQMRIFNYLPQDDHPEVQPGKKRTGSSPHTDWYLLTVILRDERSRLQIATNSSQTGVFETSWLDVPSKENELIILFGDYLSLFSGGRTKSAVHRVLLPESGSTSKSFVFLFSPRYDARLPRPRAEDLNLVAEKKSRRINTLLDQADPMIWDLAFGEYAQRKRSRVMSNQR